MKSKDNNLRRLADRIEINDCLCRYARGVDRGDLELVASTYHDDAYDDHDEYKGSAAGFIDWLRARFATVDNSIHFLGNCLIEFAGDDFAFVETYFVSRRLRAPTEAEQANLDPNDALCRQRWGRYLDSFERRKGHWRIARRIVVTEALFMSVARDGLRRDEPTWGRRHPSDLLFVEREALMLKARGEP